MAELKSILLAEDNIVNQKVAQGMLSKSRLARLPNGAAVINIARGGLLDLDALTEEVKRKRLR